MSYDDLQDLVKLVALTDFVYLSFYMMMKLQDLDKLVVLSDIVYLSIYLSWLSQLIL